jgi:hypothetical protein
VEFHICFDEVVVALGLLHPAQQVAQIPEILLIPSLRCQRRQRDLDVASRFDEIKRAPLAKQPSPWRTSMIPSSVSGFSASRTADLPTPNVRESSRSEGRRSPGSNTPDKR